MYSMAIAMNPNVAAYYSNRSIGNNLILNHWKHDTKTLDSLLYPARISNQSMLSISNQSMLSLSNQSIRISNHPTRRLLMDFVTQHQYSNLHLLANFKLEFYGAALADASDAIAIDSKFVKGYYRRASANMALGRLKEAIRDFKAVSNVVPNDKGAAEKLVICQKEQRRIEFEKAIFVDSIEKTALEMLGKIADQILIYIGGLDAINSIVVEDSYTGNVPSCWIFFYY